ncbi:hypothetical protein AAMO2058_000071200 [Amorphochlora amoebiformis]
MRVYGRFIGSYEPGNIISVIFSCFFGSPIPRVGSRAVFAALVAGTLVVVNKKTPIGLSIEIQSTIILGVLLSILIGVRLLASHRRHWFAIESLTNLSSSTEQFYGACNAIMFMRGQNLAQAKQDLLRDIVVFLLSVQTMCIPSEIHEDQILSWCKEKGRAMEMQGTNPLGRPRLALTWVRMRLAEYFKRHSKTGTSGHVYLDGLLKPMSDSYSRLKTLQTLQFSLAFAQMVKVSAVVYIVILPMGLVKSYAYWTVLINFVTALVIFGSDEAGAMMEDPFRQQGDPTFPLVDQVEALVVSLKSMGNQTYRGRSSLGDTLGGYKTILKDTRIGVNDPEETEKAPLLGGDSKKQP